jgi:phosphogluconate dehydratase
LVALTAALVGNTPGKKLMNSVIEQVTAKVRERSRESRAQYLSAMQQTRDEHPPRKRLSCGNMAHGFAACGQDDKQTIRLMESANLGIITAYNDMLSAHQPYGVYPDQIKEIARKAGCTAQIAGGVPAMCDGVTQGQAGMELSLFSRDVVAMSTAIGLSHNMFDAVLCLGICDKIVPGMLIGALQFGHLPTVFVPAGPMHSGLPNKQKAAVRQAYAQGKATDDELIEAESASYHSPGTCTFYGTANTNQMLMEMLGVQLPGSSFINPDDPLRPLLTKEAVLKAIAATPQNGGVQSLANVVTEASLINSVVGLLATGGSTNHTLHLVAIAKAAGIDLQWQDFDELSREVPLLARVYPNGEADINTFERAGGMSFMFNELNSAGLLNRDVINIMGQGLESYEAAPMMVDDRVVWSEKIRESKIPEVLTSVSAPFDKEGGLRLLSGNLGEGVIKVSAVASEHRSVEAPCRIFHDQNELKSAFDAGELERDIVVVVRFQGPQANGMPELHKLTPYLGTLQDKGFKVALVTDGRMSGASGKVPAAIHMSPEAKAGGPLGKLRDGDVVSLDAHSGSLKVLIDEQEWAQRENIIIETEQFTLGRGLFAGFRGLVSRAEAGAGVF